MFLSNNSQIIIRKNDVIHIVDFSNIVYVEKQKNSCLIHCKDQIISINISLTRLNYFLPPYFIRTHKSFIINVHYVKKIDRLSKSLYMVKFDREKEAFITTQTVNSVIQLMGENR